MKDHLNMFLAKAAKSEAVRLSFKRLRDQSAESFIELLDEVSVNSIDTVVSELNLSKVLKDGATSEDINLLVRCNRALRSVCKSSCLLPKDIRISTSLVKESDRPVAGGAYGDVWKAGGLDKVSQSKPSVRSELEQQEASRSVRCAFMAINTVTHNTLH